MLLLRKKWCGHTLNVDGNDDIELRHDIDTSKFLQWQMHMRRMKMLMTAPLTTMRTIAPCWQQQEDDEAKNS